MLQLSDSLCHALIKIMFKLLTEEARKKAMREYAVRRSVIAVASLTVVLVIALAGLFPAYILSATRKTEVEERVRVMGNIGLQGNESSLQRWLTDTNLKLQFLNPKLDKDRPSEFIEQVLQEKIIGIHITGLNWFKSRNEKGETLSLSVSGIAEDRQTLLYFENRLNISGHFAKVTLPVSNLAKEKNIVFQIKITPTQTP